MQLWRLRSLKACSRQTEGPEELEGPRLRLEAWETGEQVV